MISGYEHPISKFIRRLNGYELPIIECFYGVQEHLSSKRMDYVQLIQKIHPELLCYIETALRVRPADMPQIKSEA